LAAAAKPQPSGRRRQGMETFLQALLTGIFLGGLYGLISSGLSLIFGITQIVNFAHGDFVTLGMYATFVAFAAYGLHPLVVLPFIAVGMFVVGLGVYLVFILRTLRQKVPRPDDTHIAQIVITLALGILIQNVLLMTFSPNQRSITEVFEGLYFIGGLAINKAQFIAFIIATLCFAALYAFLNYTSFGKATQACVDDQEMAVMVGINTERVYLANFGLGIALAAIAGTILITYYPVTPVSGISFLIIAFVTVVLGGLGNVVGAFFAGLTVGIIQQMTATYVSVELQNVGLFLVFILVLLLRPQGLFGSRVAT
jgi:branched-chain amino acid transport system permease protein